MEHEKIWRSMCFCFWWLVGGLSAIFGFLHGVLERARGGNEPIVAPSEACALKPDFRKIEPDLDFVEPQIDQHFRIVEPSPRVRSNPEEREQRFAGQQGLRSQQRSRAPIRRETRNVEPEWPPQCPAAGDRRSDRPNVHSDLPQQRPALERQNVVSDSEVGAPPSSGLASADIEQPLSCFVPNADLSLRERVDRPYNCKLGRRFRPKWYGVAKGRGCGMYRSWEEASWLVDGFSDCKHQKFVTEAQCRDWIDLQAMHMDAVEPSAHRQNCVYIGTDRHGHPVFQCDCCGEVFCTNGLLARRE